MSGGGVVVLNPAFYVVDDAGNKVGVVDDAGVYRLAIDGKVSITTPGLPPTTTPVTIAADTPLAIGGNQSPHDTEYVIPSGKTFHLLATVSGAEGDPTEGGSRVDVVYVDASSVEHVVAREYLAGFSVQTSQDTAKTRDGTVMTGNGTTTKMIVRRIRLSNGSLEVDSVAFGYLV